MLLICKCLNTKQCKSWKDLQIIHFTERKDENKNLQMHSVNSKIFSRTLFSFSQFLFLCFFWHFNAVYYFNYVMQFSNTKFYVDLDDQHFKRKTLHFKLDPNTKESKMVKIPYHFYDFIHVCFFSSLCFHIAQSTFYWLINGVANKNRWPIFGAHPNQDQLTNWLSS